jgi:hypothetical protein
MIRLITLFFLFTFTSLQCSAYPITDQYISQEEYHYVTVFRFKNVVNGENQGYVLKEKNKSGSIYQIYDEYNQFLGTAEDGNTGTKASVAMLKLYDIDGNLMGTINGEYWTTQPAKFTFKTQYFNGYAYLSTNKREFEIVDLQGKAMMYLYRNIIPNAIDTWEVHALRNNQIPDFIIKAFAAFVSDTHGQFIKDN